MQRLQGIAAAPGYAIGPAFQFLPAEVRVESRLIADPGREMERLEGAVTAVAVQIRAVIEKARDEMPANEASIFEAQLLMLQDPELAASIRKTIEDKNLNAEFAVKEATERHAQVLESMQDGTFRARAADVRDVAQRLLRVLTGVDYDGPGALVQPAVIICRDLTPSDTVLLDKHQVLGLCTIEGSETSHTAILARGLGIPAVVGVGQEVLNVPTGESLVLDGTTGIVFIDPTTEILETYKTKVTSGAAAAEIASAHAREPAVTLDGRRVEVVANVGDLRGAREAVELGAEGVGLLRTEFLYLERTSLPSEAEQLQAYKAILDVFGMQPVVLRTLDVGGDKAIPYLNLAAESNPFLGVRGLRLCLAKPELFRPQLRAALQASVGHNLKIMFPMVATLEEVTAARALVDGCLAELDQEGKQVAGKIEIGIMVEIPSAAVLAEQIAPAVDFFSIGTNDLTQYTLAVDRTNAQLAYLSSAFSPAVLRLIRSVIQAGHQHGKWVGVCGELAGEPLAIPILLGLGLDEFSMTPPAIPIAKQVLRGLRVSQCEELAQRALMLSSPRQVMDMVAHELPWIDG